MHMHVTFEYLLLHAAFVEAKFWGVFVAPDCTELLVIGSNLTKHC